MYGYTLNIPESSRDPSSLCVAGLAKRHAQAAASNLQLATCNKDASKDLGNKPERGSHLHRRLMRHIKCNKLCCPMLHGTDLRPDHVAGVRILIIINILAASRCKMQAKVRGAPAKSFFTICIIYAGNRRPGSWQDVINQKRSGIFDQI